jgi:hypothetical protein
MVGDLGNIEADDAGVAKVSYENSYDAVISSLLVLVILCMQLVVRIACNGARQALLTITSNTGINAHLLYMYISIYAAL